MNRYVAVELSGMRVRGHGATVEEAEADCASNLRDHWSNTPVTYVMPLVDYEGMLEIVNRARARDMDKARRADAKRAMAEGGTMTSGKKEPKHGPQCGCTKCWPMPASVRLDFQDEQRGIKTHHTSRHWDAGHTPEERAEHSEVARVWFVRRMAWMQSKEAEALRAWEAAVRGDD